MQIGKPTTNVPENISRRARWYSVWLETDKLDVGQGLPIDLDNEKDAVSLMNAVSGRSTKTRKYIRYRDPEDKLRIWIIRKPHLKKVD